MKIAKYLLRVVREQLLPYDFMHKSFQSNHDSLIRLIHDDSVPRSMIDIERVGKSLNVHTNIERLSSDPEFLRIMGIRSLGPLKIMAAKLSGTTRIRFDLSDGDHEYDAPHMLSFCSNRAHALLIPDSDFFSSYGYAKLRTEPVPAWENRTDIVLWRGSTTGRGLITDSNMQYDNQKLILRIRLCIALRNASHTNVKISNVTQSNDAERDKALLFAEGLMADHIPTMQWQRVRYAIDVDGNSNAWANLFQRLLLGCCILKIGSANGYKQWYYDKLVPWYHYVPVRPDLSDLRQQIDFCMSNPSISRLIAKQGRELAQSLLYQQELEKSVTLVNSI